MKAKLLSAITLSLIIPAASLAYDSINGDTHRKKVDITQTPKPARMVDEPVAEYNTATGTLTICNNTNQFQLKTYGNSVAFALFDPNSLVMVRAHGKLPYIAPFVLQNTTINKSQYVIASDVVAGRSVDSGRTAGDVIIAAGVDYEIEHKGTVTLAPGFKVEKGASLTVKPSEY